MWLVINHLVGQDELRGDAPSMVVESPLRLPWVLCQAYDAQIFTAPTRSPQKPKNLPLLKRMTQENTAFEQFSNILPRLDVFVTG